MTTKTTGQLVGEIAAKYADDVLEEFEDRVFGHVGGVNVSPIQQVMAAALFYYLKSPSAGFSFYGPEHNELHYQSVGSEYEIKFETYRPIKEWPQQEKRYTTGIRITPEVSIGKYRADFFVEVAYNNNRAFGVIECDGHDYHERTKEQAQHDKERDRFFQRNGLLVLRYTGSEIWKDPLKVARDALTIILNRAEAKIRANG